MVKNRMKIDWKNAETQCFFEYFLASLRFQPKKFSQILLITQIL